MTLSAAENPVIDIKLDVGAMTDQVTVTAEAPPMTTSNATLGQVITTAEVEDVPINGRTPGMLGNLAMGVISTFEPGPVRPFDNSAVNSITIGGAPATHNEMLLNGAPNAGQANQMAYSPMQDAVTEVRVAAFDMDAANGHAMGGSVNVITKSGTNGLHEHSLHLQSDDRRSMPIRSSITGTTSNVTALSSEPVRRHRGRPALCAQSLQRQESHLVVLRLGRHARFRPCRLATRNRQPRGFHQRANRRRTRR